MTALSINESLFYIPFDHTGVISVCNNKYLLVLLSGYQGMGDRHRSDR